MNTRSRFVKVLAVLTLVSGTLPAWSQTRTKADNTTSLSLASSYVENSTIPNSTITLIVDNTLTANSTTASLGGNLSVLGINMNAAPVSGASRTFQVGATTGASLTIFGGGITKALNTSALIFNNAVTLGANQTWTVNSSTGNGTGNLQMNGAFSDGGYTLNVAGNGIFDLRGSNTFGSNVIIDASISVNAAAATVVFGGANTANSFTVAGGRAQGSTIGNFGVASSFGDGGTNTTITLGGNNQNGVLEYTGSSTSTNRTFTRDTRGTLSGIDVSTAGQTLTVTSNLLSSGVQAADTNWNFGGAGNLALSGTIAETANATLNQGVVKNGAGTLTLSGNNTYAGGTQVNAGTLLVNNVAGSGTGTGTVVIAAGATLGGNGTISGATTVNGIIAPGNSIGTLNITNTVTWNSNDAWKFELGAAGVAMLTPGTSDLLNITGSFTKGTGTAFTFDFLGGGAQGWYKLADWTVGTTFLATDFVATNLGSGLSGNFTVDSGTSALYLNVVPEPSTWLLAGLGLTGIAVLRRRSSTR